jgi:hypothetical protein
MNSRTVDGNQKTEKPTDRVLMQLLEELDRRLSGLVTNIEVNVFYFLVVRVTAEFIMMTEMDEPLELCRSGDLDRSI